MRAGALRVDIEREGASLYLAVRQGESFATLRLALAPASALAATLLAALTPDGPDHYQMALSGDLTAKGGEL